MRTAIHWIGILLAIFALSSGVASAEEKIYRWVDQDGVVHFGNQAEAGAGAQEVNVQRQPAYTASPAAQQTVTSDSNPASSGQQPTSAEDNPVSVAQQRRDQRAKERKEAAAAKEEIAARCELHKKLVEQLEPRPRVIVQREDGTVERMDDNERLDQLKKSKDFIAENCN